MFYTSIFMLKDRIRNLSEKFKGINETFDLMKNDDEKNFAWKSSGDADLIKTDFSVMKTQLDTEIIPFVNALLKDLTPDNHDSIVRGDDNDYEVVQKLKIVSKALESIRKSILTVNLIIASTVNLGDYTDSAEDEFLNIEKNIDDIGIELDSLV